MDLKQQHTTDEMVINDMKLVQTYNNDEENHKYRSQIPTATWPPLQYTRLLAFLVFLSCFVSYLSAMPVNLNPFWYLSN